MSMMKTLVKVAIGVAVAKGMSSMTGAATSAPRRSAPRKSTGLEDMMSAILGGSGGARQSAGGIGDLLSELGGAGTARRTTTRRTRTDENALGGLLTQLGAGAAAGGLGGLLGGMLGAGAGGLGASLNSAFANKGEPDTPPSPAEDATAALLLKAMIQAAKSDGQIDAQEQEKLMAHLGEVSEAERAFVARELEAPVDVEALARAVPEGLEPQVYTMSAMAIELDEQSEAQYLHSLAEALGLAPAEVNAIHEKIGAPALYA